jgi:AAA domain/CHC2 zinc finger
MLLSYEQIRRYFEHRHPGQRIAAREKAAVRCAFHSEDTPSCTLFLDGNGGFNCHACGAKGNLFQFEARLSGCSLDEAERKVAEITGAVPEPRREGDANLGTPVALYDYRDENGITLYQKRRYEPELGAKTFRIFRTVDGQWKPGIDAKEGEKTRRVLYNLPHLVKANLVYLCEGEKDCENVMNAGLLAKHGFAIAATTSFDGAWQKGHSPKWLESYSPYFTGKHVVIFADNDEPGQIYAETAAAAIARYAYRVRIVSFPELPEKGDVSDFLATNPVEALERRVTETPPWTGVASQRENWLVEGVEWCVSANPEIEWLVDGVIQAGGNGLIAAEPKTGKSLVALDLLISMACGVPWLGRKIPRRVKTAYISREDSPLLTKVRMQALLKNKVSSGVDPEGWLWVNTREQLGSFDVDDEEQVANLTADLKERGIEFAVFDVLNRIHNRDENNNGEMAQVVKKIGKIGEDAGCQIGVIHHVSKENATGRFFTRIRGASAIYGWTEWSIGLTIENPGEKKQVRKAEFETKAAESCEPISFTIQHGGGNLSLEVAERGPAAFDPTKHTDGAMAYLER